MEILVPAHEALDGDEAQHACSGISSFVVIFHVDSGIQYIYASQLQGVHTY